MITIFLCFEVAIIQDRLKYRWDSLSNTSICYHYCCIY